MVALSLEVLVHEIQVVPEEALKERTLTVALLVKRHWLILLYVFTVVVEPQASRVVDDFE